MHCCDTFTSPHHLAIPTNPTTTSSPSTRTSFTKRVSFPTRPTYQPIQARSTINDGPTTGPSFYDLLGIPETGTPPEIKQAYKQLALKYHPDVSPPGMVKEYTERFIMVQEAYETLSDPRRRALYDRDMARGLHLAFSARRKVSYAHEDTEDKSDWRDRWESQLSELKRRSMHREARGNMSWGARMRRQRNES